MCEPRAKRHRPTPLSSIDHSFLRGSACPGLMRIVQARDGGLARLRLAGGVLSVDAARAIARAAVRCGSGVIEVTNRANLQLRGIRDAAHAELIDIAFSAGLGPSVAGGDDLRNVMLSPLASDDMRTLAARIVHAMQADASLHALSPKFALQLDGGERLAMLDHPHDVWLSSTDDGTRFAFGFVDAITHGALGFIACKEAQRFVMTVLHAFVEMASPEERRMRDLLARIGIERFLDVLPVHAPASEWRRAQADASLRFGVHATHVGGQPPLGRLDAYTLEALADLAPSRLVMTPWQSVLIPDVDATRAHEVLARMNALGLATEKQAPFARLIACAGSQGCAKSHADTKADVHRLAPLLPHETSAHLSGCERSCAAAHPIDATLIACAPGCYDLYHHARLVACAQTIEEAAAWLARSHVDA
ncbi:Cobalamin biosynthesis protein CobG [Candidatus Burkholderia humilis]|nr:Cobalamin biosynthesis protein CobG [Candidatus Burkholderia humilis]